MIFDSMGTEDPMRDQASDPITLALKLLAKELQCRLQRHPEAHLLKSRGDSIELRIRVPIARQRKWLVQQRAAISESLGKGIRQALLRHAICRPGHILCLRCSSTECAHAAPKRSTEVFAGYGPSGTPRFSDLGQFLLDCRDPRVDLLYRTPPALLAHTTAGEDLSRHLLPAFRDRDSGYHIHGQVTAGWYDFPSEFGYREPLALTFQVFSTQSPQVGRRLGLNLIGTGPDDQPLENLYDLTGEIPWFEALRWAQRTLTQIEKALSRRSDKLPDERVEKRLKGLLSGLANRLERERRSRDRKTDHGHKRHRQKTRPTWKALADLSNAKPDQVLVDTRRDTYVVLGSHGRAHIFNRSARLVTSIRYSPDAIDKRRRRGVWKPAVESEIEALKTASETQSR